MSEKEESNFMLRITHDKGDNFFNSSEDVIGVLADLIESHISGVEIDRKNSREVFIEMFKKENKKKDGKDSKEVVAKKVEGILNDIAGAGKVKNVLEQLIK